MNKHLQNAFDKYGESAFSFEPLIICEKNKEILTLYENAVLSIYQPDRLYNKRPNGADSSLGMRHTPETRAKMSAAGRGKTKSPEHRAKIAASQKGKKKRPETIARWVATRRARGSY